MITNWFMLYAYSTVYLVFMFWRDKKLDGFTEEDIEKALVNEPNSFGISIQTILFLMFFVPVVNTALLIKMSFEDIKMLIKQYKR